MMQPQNAPDEGAFSSFPGLDQHQLRSEIQGREFITASKLHTTVRTPADWTAALLYSIHRDIFGKHFPDHAGRNRQGEANFGRHAAPPPEQLEGLVSQLLASIRDHLQTVQTLPLDSEERIGQTFLFAATDHGEMIRIHPFIDGNGRWARIATNAFLIDCGLPTGTIIRKADKAQYIAALDRYIEKRASGDLAEQMLAGYVRELEKRAES